MFDKQVYINRRKKLAANFTNGLLLFMGNEESPMNYKDNTYHFRQDSSFLYYFGINEPNLAAVIDIDSDEIIVFGNEMSLDDIVWMGRQKTLREKSAEIGVEQLFAYEDLNNYISGTLTKKLEVHYLPPYRGENVIRLASLLGVSVQHIKVNASVAFIKAVVAQRSIKAEEEIVELNKAAAISADIHQMIMQNARVGMYERELAAQIHQAALASGGNLAYPPILTVRGEVLHNHYYGNQLRSGQMVLNDSGVETAMGYAGDLTRTFPVDKKFTPEQRDIYTIVLNSYYSAVAKLAPGTTYLSVHLQACKTLTEGLKDIGLMKGNVEDAVALGAHAMFFQCGTGHMMGLDVHDMEDLGEQYVGYTDQMKKNTTQFGIKSLRLGKALEDGHVLTVEPGVYIIPELIQKWGANQQFTDYINYDKLKQFEKFSGIRVEDDFVITNDGAQMLGKYLAITVEEIEELRA